MGIYRKLIQMKSCTQAKYIETLLKASERKKVESERRRERKAQKEREEEGDAFADKVK